MKTAKKVLCLVMALAMVVCAFAGCGDDTTIASAITRHNTFFAVFILKISFSTFAV